MDCPLCWSSMKLRTARHGPNAGKRFWGCSQYPSCKGARPANDEAVKRRLYYTISERFHHLTRRNFLRYEVRKISGLFLFAVVGAILYFAASVVDFAASMVTNAPSPLPSSVSIDIVDGDTVRSRGKVYRLVGFNTPEAGLGAGCEQERMLASKAKQRLRRLIEAGNLELEPVRCACQPGTEGTYRCNFGRSCAVLRSRGQNVGSILISEGLAETYVCGSTTCPQRRNWCD